MGTTQAHGVARVKFPIREQMATEHRYRNFVGPKIRQLRIAADMKQEDLCTKLNRAGLHNFDRVTVAKIESQIRSVYDFEAAIIATVLGVAPGELFPPLDDVEAEVSKLTIPPPKD